MAVVECPQPPAGESRAQPPPSAPAAERARLGAAIVALLFCAGMLRSEVAALRWQDVELTSTPGQVRVRTAKTNPAAERED